MRASRTDKIAALKKIAGQIASCRRCRLSGVGTPVVGEGDPDAEIVFVGEAPGRREAQLGRPFIGRAGQWLRRAIRNIGLDERAVYFINSVTYHPVDRKPSQADIVHGRLHLLRQLKILNPRIVVLLGSTACLSVLDENMPVRARHGSLVKRDGRTYLITCHPAAAARFPAIRTAVEHDFRKLKALVARGTAPRSRCTQRAAPTSALRVQPAGRLHRYRDRRQG